MKIGVRLESLGLTVREGLPKLARLGVGGVQIDAIGDLAPDRLTETGKRELKNLLRTYALDLTALTCPLRRSLDDAENQQARVEYIRKAMALAFELGPRIVVVPCPRLPGESEPARADLLRLALDDLGRYGDRIGTVLALEIGFDSPEAMRDYLNTFDVGSLKVNYDPANLLLNGFDPVKGVIPLHRHIVHTQARDGRPATVSGAAREVPLGAGDVDWLSYIATLASVDYRGWLTIRRETGDEKLKDMEAAIAFLKRMVGAGS